MDVSRRVTLNDPSHLLGQQCFEVLLTSLIFVQKLPQPLGDALLYNVQLVCSMALFVYANDCSLDTTVDEIKRTTYIHAL